MHTVSTVACPPMPDARVPNAVSCSEIIVIAVANSLQIPVKYVGVGEQMDDLMPFDPAAFVEALV